VTANTNETLKGAQKLLGDVDAQINPLAANVNKTLANARKVMNGVDDQVNPLVDSFRGTASAATRTLEHAEKTLAAVEDAIGKDSQVVYQVNQTLKELAAVARSIRVWADYLERHPEALLRGKK